MSYCAYCSSAFTAGEDSCSGCGAPRQAASRSSLHRVLQEEHDAINPESDWRPLFIGALFVLFIFTGYTFWSSEKTPKREAPIADEILARHQEEPVVGACLNAVTTGNMAFATSSGAFVSWGSCAKANKSKPAK